MQIRRGVAALVMTAATASVVRASPIVFATSGANGVSATATFNFSATSFTVTLENLTTPIAYTTQELDGLVFRLGGGSGSPTLTGASSVPFVDCSGDHTYPCDPYAGAIPANNGWGSSTSTGLTTLSPFPLGTHPYAIINDSYQLPNSGNGNLANGQHNPFMVGPVTFTFDGTFASVGDVQFWWGTVPDITTGSCNGCVTTTEIVTPPVPEPMTLVLLGSGLVIVARRLRKRAPGNN